MCGIDTHLLGFEHLLMDRKVKTDLNPTYYTLPRCINLQHRKVCPDPLGSNRVMVKIRSKKKSTRWLVDRLDES